MSYDDENFTCSLGQQGHDIQKAPSSLPTLSSLPEGGGAYSTSREPISAGTGASASGAILLSLFPTIAACLVSSTGSHPGPGELPYIWASSDCTWGPCWLVGVWCVKGRWPLLVLVLSWALGGINVSFVTLSGKRNNVQATQ